VKVYISVDMEGIGGVVDREQLLPTGRFYERARRYMVDEMRCAVEAAWEAGAEAVTVNDSHDGMLTLAWEELESLPPETTLISGTGKRWSMGQGLEGHDLALFVGYHAMAGTPRAVMDHTYSGDVYRLRVNGQEVGETGLNAYVAGHFGVPVVLVAGDQALAAEAKALLPAAEIVVTKEAQGRQSARLFSPAVVRQRLRDGVRRALQRWQDGQAQSPLTLSGPYTVEVGFMTTHAADLAALLPDAVRVDGRTVAVTRPTVLEAYLAFRAMIRLGGDVPLY
jgi:D-amino peptidase